MSALAYVISAHGFGHAARSAAVLEALARRADAPERVAVLTTVPEWFFRQSLSRTDGFEFRRVPTDLGLVQSNSLEEDLEATLTRLEQHLEQPDGMIGPLEEALREIEPDAVACDISPWGLAAAARLGLPAVLVENFTWSFIYRGYGDRRLERCARGFERLFRADHHLRLEPFCG
ncbi:MAG: hypothetical protein AAF725_13155, partial [Acidobacteriota bacterium]